MTLCWSTFNLNICSAWLSVYLKQLGCGGCGWWVSRDFLLNCKVQTFLKVDVYTSDSFRQIVTIYGVITCDWFLMKSAKWHYSMIILKDTHLWKTHLKIVSVTHNSESISKWVFSTYAESANDFFVFLRKFLVLIDLLKIIYHEKTLPHI